MARSFIEFTSELNEKQFDKLTSWNMYCRKKAMTVILLVMYAFSIWGVAFALMSAKYRTPQETLVSGGISLIGVIVVGSLVFTQRRRAKKSIKQGNLEEKTRKEIRMTNEEIVVYRVKADDRRVYSWADMDGIYNYLNLKVFAMKDGQIFCLDPAKEPVASLEFVEEQADVSQLNKKSLSMKTIRYVALGITAFAIGLTSGLGQ